MLSTIINSNIIKLRKYNGVNDKHSQTRIADKEFLRKSLPFLERSTTGAIENR